jgi:hypothetical protein
MVLRTCTLTTLLAALLLAAGCGSPQRPPPPVDEVPDAGPEPEAAPPPKCEALDEKCKAKGDTSARIGTAGLTITPISGWTYAQGESVLVAQKSDDGAAMAVTSYEIPAPANAKVEGTNRDAAYEAVAKEIGVTLPKKKPNWKKGDAPKEVGTMKLNLWEMEGATRGEKKGLLLVFASSAPISENKGLVGLGFVPEDDADAEKIGEALQAAIDSLKPAEAPPTEENK